MKEAKSSLVDSMDSTHRDEAVLRIIELCNIKRYRDETVFLAINIFDRVFSDIYHRIKLRHIPLFIVVCTIMAAKIEQPMTPSINRMIMLLPQEEREIVTKEKVICLEE